MKQIPDGWDLVCLTRAIDGAGFGATVHTDGPRPMLTLDYGPPGEPPIILRVADPSQRHDDRLGLGRLTWDEKRSAELMLDHLPWAAMDLVRIGRRGPIARPEPTS